MSQDIGDTSDRGIVGPGEGVVDVEYQVGRSGRWARLGTVGLVLLLPASALLALGGYAVIGPMATVVAAAGAVVATSLLVVGTWGEARAAGAGIGEAFRAILRDLRDVVSTMS